MWEMRNQKEKLNQTKRKCVIYGDQHKERQKRRRKAERQTPNTTRKGGKKNEQMTSNNTRLVGKRGTQEPQQIGNNICVTGSV